MKYQQPYIRPMGKPIKQPLWLRVAKWLLSAIVVATFALLGAILILEWMAGCGETYIDAKGERHANECLFISTNR